MPRTTGSSSSSTAAGVPGRTRSTYAEQAILEVRLRSGSCPMGGHPQHLCSRVGRRGRHRALRCRSLAVRARCGLRAVPDLRQRALALRTPPRRSRLPAHVRRPYARPEDAAVTRPAGSVAGGSTPSACGLRASDGQDRCISGGWPEDLACAAAMRAPAVGSLRPVTRVDRPGGVPLRSRRHMTRARKAT